MPKKEDRFDLIIPAEMKAKAREIAKSQGQTLTAMIRFWLSEKIKEFEKNNNKK